MSEILDAAKGAAMAVEAAEWEAFTAWVLGDERRRRTTAKAAEKAADAARDEVVAEYLEANPPAKDEDGVDVWTQPTGAFDSWPSEHIVTHNGAVWLNNLGRPNPHEPGALNSGWVRQTEPDSDGIVDWAVGLDVKAGDRVRHDGRVWSAVLDHVTHDGWKPGPNTYAVWKLEDAPVAPEAPTEPEPDVEPDVEPGEEPGVEGDEDTAAPTAPDWKQPIGSHDAYKRGDRITYNGAVYESLLPANVYSPDAYPQGWKKI